MRTYGILALAASLATAFAQALQGFNYGSVFTNNAPITGGEYERLFNTAKQLAGTSGAFTSARLFTTIQAGTPNAPTEAIAAADATQTKLLLGIFLSSTEEQFQNELTALRSAITQYGQRLVDLVIGISVGSEDLYRISPTGILNRSNPGEGPDAVVRRINAVRQALAGTILSGAPIGHVDTWTAYVNSSNTAVISACDFIGVDAYPYFQNTQANSIENGESLFFAAYDATVAVSQGKPVWITETGWPVSGPTENQAVPSTQNAEAYWDSVGCRAFGQINTFWFTLQDAFPNAPSPSFGVVGSTLSTTPLYDLTCPNDSQSSSSSADSSSPSSSVAPPTGTSDTPPDTETSTTPAPESPGSNSGSPGSNSGSPGSNSGSAGSNSGSAGSNSGSAGSNSGSAGSNSGSPGSNSGSPGSNGGSPGPNGGSPGSNGGSGSNGDSPGSNGGPPGSNNDGSGSAPVENTVPPTVQTIMTYVTVTTCPVTYTSGAETKTSMTTSTVAVTSTHGNTLSTVATPPSTPSPSSAPGACPANLNGDFEFPHLIVPVDKNQPDAALGTSFNGLITPTVSSLFNFDFPASLQGRTCSLVFLFPTRDQLQTSNYTLSGSGGFLVELLNEPADSATSFNNQPEVNVTVNTVPDVQPGNSYVVGSGACFSNARIGYKVSATGSLDLDYFQDYNPAPIGLYVTVC